MGEKIIPIGSLFVGRCYRNKTFYLARFRVGDCVRIPFAEHSICGIIVSQENTETVLHTHEGKLVEKSRALRAYPMTQAAFQNLERGYERRNI
jgi:hypothetical protein